MNSDAADSSKSSTADFSSMMTTLAAGFQQIAENIQEMTKSVFTDDFIRATTEIKEWADKADMSGIAETEEDAADEKSSNRTRAICTECHVIHASDYEITYHFEMNDGETTLFDYCCFCGTRIINAPTIDIDPRLIIFEYEYEDWFEDKNGPREEY